MSRHTTHGEPAHGLLNLRLERGLSRFSRLLRLLALSAPPIIIDREQRLIEKSLAELDLGFAELARLYTRDRLRLEGLAAIERAAFARETQEAARAALAN